VIFVSVTRLRIRSLRFLPRFALYAVRSLRQCKRMPGFRDGSLLADRKLTFWTMTRWQDQSAMRAYMSSGAHLKAMPLLLHWCDEASVVHWMQEDAARPDWEEADGRMRTQGRPSKVRHPSPDHASLGFAAPRTAGAVPITPA
jgi:heme-degrading monooxygenase HmoA